MELSVAAWMLLIAVTTIGALAQSAVGIGFALITMPFYLLLLEVRDAVQLAIMLTIALTIVMLPKIYHDIPRDNVRSLLLGSIIGFPLGLLFFLYASATMIKIIIALTILIALFANAINAKKSSRLPDTRTNGMIAGVFAGAMTTSIAMAGPAIAIYMQAIAASKRETRAAIFCVYIFSYVGAILMHGYFYGISRSGLTLSLWLLSPVLLGVYVGDRLSAMLPEKLFARMISALLFIMAFYLLYSVT